MFIWKFAHHILFYVYQSAAFVVWLNCLEAFMMAVVFLFIQVLLYNKYYFFVNNSNI